MNVSVMGNDSLFFGGGRRRIIFDKNMMNFAWTEFAVMLRPPAMPSRLLVKFFLMRLTFISLSSTVRIQLWIVDSLFCFLFA